MWEKNSTVPTIFHVKIRQIFFNAYTIRTLGIVHDVSGESL